VTTYPQIGLDNAGQYLNDVVYPAYERRSVVAGNCSFDKGAAVQRPVYFSLKKKPPIINRRL
jgi:hypothetical protein